MHRESNPVGLPNLFGESNSFWSNPDTSDMASQTYIKFSPGVTRILPGHLSVSPLFIPGGCALTDLTTSHRLSIAFCRKQPSPRERPLSALLFVSVAFYKTIIPATCDLVNYFLIYTSAVATFSSSASSFSSRALVIRSCRSSAVKR